MKRSIIMCLVLMSLVSRAQVQTLVPGQPAPDIKLPGVNGRVVSFDDYPAAKGFVIIFIGNTCPYSKAYIHRIMELDQKYTPLGFPVIAVNPNDPDCSPGDGFEEMKKHATSMKYTFPYLYDKGQVTTYAYGPRSTPYVFVIGKSASGNVIQYTGAIDNDTPGSDPDKVRFVDEAVNALLANKHPAMPSTRAIGCGICWKK